MNGLSSTGRLTLAGSSSSHSSPQLIFSTPQQQRLHLHHPVKANNSYDNFNHPINHQQQEQIQPRPKISDFHFESNSSNNMQAYDSLDTPSSMQFNQRYSTSASHNSYGAILEPDEGSSEYILDLDSNTVRRYPTIGDNNGVDNASPYNNMGYQVNHQARANTTTIDQITQSKSHHWNHAMQYVNQQHHHPGFPPSHQQPHHPNVTTNPSEDNNKWSSYNKSNNDMSSNGSINNNNASGTAAPASTGNGSGNELKKPKSYQCDACDKWFTSSGHLKRHFNTTLHKNAIKHRTGLGSIPSTTSSNSSSVNNAHFTNSTQGLNDSTNYNSMRPEQQQQQQHSISKYNSTSPGHNDRTTANSLVTQNITSHNVPNTSPATLGYYEHQVPNPQQQCNNASLRNANSPTTQGFPALPQMQSQQQHNGPTKSPHPFIQQQQTGSVDGSVSTCIYEQRSPSNPMLTYSQALPLPPQSQCHDMYSSADGQQQQRQAAQTQQQAQQQQQQPQQQPPQPQQTPIYQNNVSIHSSSGYNSNTLSPTTSDPYNIHFSGYPFNGLSSYSPSTDSDANSMFQHSDTNQGQQQTNATQSLFSSSETASSPYSLPDDQGYIGDGKFSPSSESGVKSPREKSDVGEFRCNDCNKTFNRICYLKQHNKSFHNGEKPYKCGQCGKRFPVEVLYQEHLAKHAGDKPYKCEVCPKQFNHKTDLRRHMCLHTGEKPFTCDVCGKGFIREDRMIKHSDTHKKKQNNMLIA